jgi:hypothetical protein
MRGQNWFGGYLFFFAENMEKDRGIRLEVAC